MLPLAPHLAPNLGKECDLVEQLRATLAIICLWQPLQTSLYIMEPYKNLYLLFQLHSLFKSASIPSYVPIFLMYGFSNLLGS